jgi:hypothetical protein
LDTEKDAWREDNVKRDMESTKDCSYDFISQEMPRATKSWKRRGRIFPYRFQRAHGSSDTLIADSWPPDCEDNTLQLI